MGTSIHQLPFKIFQVHGFAPYPYTVGYTEIKRAGRQILPATLARIHQELGFLLNRNACDMLVPYKEVDELTALILIAALQITSRLKYDADHRPWHEWQGLLGNICRSIDPRTSLRCSFLENHFGWEHVAYSMGGEIQESRWPIVSVGSVVSGG